ncbi:hypothetical protein ACA910_019947 [Epithemia clementina (nom. ined.)]
MTSLLLSSSLLLLPLLFLALTTDRGGRLVVDAAVARIQIASPLQALTIWDREVLGNSNGNDNNKTKTPTSWRSAFLPKYQIGLQAETAVRKEFEQKRKELQAKVAAQAARGGNQHNWAARAQAAEQRLAQAEERAVEAAFDRATQEYERQQKQRNMHTAKQQPTTKNPNTYQFVGVVHPATTTSIKTFWNSSPITWYARPKPRNAKWSIRLVHVNRPAILKDLFQQGKVDLFARYTNTGRVDETTGLPIITSHYQVKERSWRNMWNFSPKHFITDSSGMYWRERRLRPGLYTDGKTVYETAYRYSDGRNGLYPKSSLDTLLKSSAIPLKTKTRIQQRLQQDVPDLVVEEY